MPDRPVIAAIGCGGTISSLGRDSTDVLDYPDFGTKLPIDEVLGRYPELAKVADMLPVPFRSVGSTAIGPPEWLELAATIDRLAAERPELAGFVIPHGTATLEETAYFLNLALKSDKTVVVVGGQRPATAASFRPDWRRAFRRRLSGSPWSGRAAPASSSCNRAAPAAAAWRCAAISMRPAWSRPTTSIRRRHASF